MGGLSEASRLRMTERSQYEVIVIGAGIAGASFAHFLSERGVTDVLVVERESVAGYHATGRSAAMAFEFDPDATVQRLKVAGVQFLREPGEGFSHHPLLEPRGVLLVYKEPLWSGIQNVAEHTWKTQGLAIDLLSAAQACERVEVLKADEFDGALLLREAARIDVHELLSSYLRGARSRGVEIRHGVEVSGEPGRARSPGSRALHRSRSPRDGAAPSSTTPLTALKWAAGLSSGASTIGSTSSRSRAAC
jgi:D-arginine dehydrogenase